MYFFGYGANRDIQKMTKVLGVTPKGVGAIIEGYYLFYQTLEQIPEPPRELLANFWEEDFKAYTIDSGKGIVVGMAWEIDEKQLGVIKEWEFVGLWREIIQVQIKTSEGKILSGVTEKAIESDKVEGVCDGINYPNNLNSEMNALLDQEKNQRDAYRVAELRRIRGELKDL